MNFVPLITIRSFLDFAVINIRVGAKKFGRSGNCTHGHFFLALPDTSTLYVDEEPSHTEHGLVHVTDVLETGQK